MKDVLRLSLPLTLWLIAFSALYGLQGWICAGAPEAPAPLGRPALLALALAAVLAQALLLGLLAGRRWGADPGFLRRTSLSLALVALIATIWTSAPIVLLPLCAG